jgi:hypothetical protein
MGGAGEGTHQIIRLCSIRSPRYNHDMWVVCSGLHSCERKSIRAPETVKAVRFRERTISPVLRELKYVTSTSGAAIPLRLIGVMSHDGRFL